jgi:hypothetical protein
VPVLSTGWRAKTATLSREVLSTKVWLLFITPLSPEKPFVNFLASKQLWVVVESISVVFDLRPMPRKRHANGIPGAQESRR